MLFHCLEYLKFSSKNRNLKAFEQCEKPIFWRFF